MRRTLLGGMLLGLVVCCGVADPEADAADSTADHLDMLDIANSWTDKADPKNPDVAGPIWFASSMKVRGLEVDVRAVLRGRPREPVGVFSKGGFAETGSFGLLPGRYGVLVQYKENGDAAEGTPLGAVKIFEYADVMRGATLHAQQTAEKTLGSLTVTAASPIGSGGWRRAYLRFEVPEAPPGSAGEPIRRIHIDNRSAGIEWQFGLVAIHREGRPFYGIGHNPNSIARLDEALAQGANAIEPDFRESSDVPRITNPEDGFVAVTEEGIVPARAPRGRSSRTRVVEGRRGSRAGEGRVTRSAKAARGLDHEARRRCLSA